MKRPVSSSERGNPLAVKEVIAKRIIEAARRGQSDVQQLKSFALEGINAGGSNGSNVGL